MSLAVKYRPKDFESLVGQTFVKETLREAVKEDKLVGAYLFCGPRGTGKTSVARMMAKTINCLNPVGGNPCHKCEICVSIGDNKLMDIIEIDAASNTGVDNIRDLIERAQFLPNVAKYKVYIIDEVHMLSTGAFNALLKILEEPPKHVKFILATTEIHKIPETILSRCQRYDFKNIGDTDLKARLEYIAKEEKIKTDSKSIDFIVKNSHGGLRNAITLFEQFIFNSEIVFDNIIKNMGITESSFVKEFLDKLINHDKSVVYDFDKLIENGKNVKLFFKDLIYQVRDEIITNISTGISICELNNILEILDETYSKTKNSMDEKITLLSGILRVVTRGESNNCVISSEVERSFGESKKSIISKNDVVSKEQIPPLQSEGQKKAEEGQFKKREPKKEYEAFEVCDLDIGEALDVFGAVDEEKKSETSSNNTGFKRDDFIAKVKELGGKGSVTMGLRGSEIKFDGTNLSIKAPSKIALNSFQDVSSKEIIVHAMDDLGFSDVKLKVE
ncbi:DNA polymerase III subunit gamma/tau [Candidatus Gracilibacteria bacterium]|nr:DNA polymerase III subunit gamma/tau [Candidatus Gracilibacteria bacterium]